MGMATKTKRTRIYPGNTRPPADIRDKTKERRAWLANRLADLQSTTSHNLEACVVGKGSYEEIAVWELQEVAGRLRHRGHCQFCGRSQVVKQGSIVLHGYTRPGDGYIFNECPGEKLPPLELSNAQTHIWLKDAKFEASQAKTVLELCEVSFASNSKTVYGFEENNDGIGAAARALASGAMPKTPRSDQPNLQSQYKWAMDVWSTQFPEYAAYVKARQARDAAQSMVWRTQSNVRHFEQLLEFKYTGKPLQQEVVT